MAEERFGVGIEVLKYASLVLSVVMWNGLSKGLTWTRTIWAWSIEPSGALLRRSTLRRIPTAAAVAILRLTRTSILLLCWL
jgi:hypothetical protein